ncbi:tetratricopeptide repeat protein [Microvirga arabica]|uniref:Tetratricopeptide repeat protein n=1 Tax=Microvirga arabica TaxID=1128671 RepID=A0ABV6Y7F4_9HYPH
MLVDTSLEKRAFFVSFNQADRSWATWIAWVLEEAGYSVWFQDWDFRGNFIEHMQRAHQTAERTLMVLSDHYLGSDFTTSEWSARFAEDPAAHDDRLVPIKVGPVADRGILRPLVYADLINCDEAEAQRRLLERVKKAIDVSYRPKPQDRPGFPGAPAREVQVKPLFPTGVPAYPEIFENVPPRDLNFTGREVVLSQLHRRLMDFGRPAAITQAAIHGLGGIGKTSLATEYAHRHASEYAGVWWAPAENRTVLLASLAALAGRLDPSLAKEADQEKAARAGLAHLVRSAAPYLLIYDNVEAPDALHGLVPSAGARVLVTTRWADWGGQANELELDVLGPEAAVAFLQKRAGRGDKPGAMRLAQALGYLPLALDHAGAYCRLSGLSFDAYRKRIDTRITQAPQSAAYPASVAATFGLAIEKAVAEQPMAENLLGFCADLAPERIPLDLIASQIADEDERAEALMTLAAVSLIDHTELHSGGSAVTLHNLVQVAVRARLTDRGEAQEIKGRVIRCLAEAFPSRAYRDTSVWPCCAVLLPHVLALHSQLDRGLGSPGLARLLYAAGNYLHGRGAYAEAELLFKEVITIDEQALGRHHHELAPDLSKLAHIYSLTGRYDEAELLFKEALTVTENTFGRDHPNVATTLGNLANIYSLTGRYAEAEPLFKEALTIAEKTLGRDRPEVATVLGKLAKFYSLTGRYAEAEPLFKESLAIDEQTLGRDRPEVASDLSDLANFYSLTGRYAEAEPLFREALAITEKTLGRDHPKVTTCLNNLATLLKAVNRHPEAEAVRASSGLI